MLGPLDKAKPDDVDAGRSLAATLKLAAAKGYIQREDRAGSSTEPPTVSNPAKRVKLESKSYTIEEKRDDSSRRRDHRPRGGLRLVEEDDFVPNVNLEYTDDAGRKLTTPKEAFRDLCHKFHGKGPGKNKIDKRLRKQEMESKAKESLSTEFIPESFSRQISKQKELKSPYIVLSKGK